MTPRPDPDARPRSSATGGGTSSHVVLTGRMGGSITERELPSGDVIVSFTVVVDRPSSRRPAGSPVTVDAVPCQVLTPSLRDRVAGIPEGTLIKATGVLRRRFWRSAGGLGSALEVEVSRVSRAGGSVRR